MSTRKAIKTPHPTKIKTIKVRIPIIKDLEGLECAAVFTSGRMNPPTSGHVYLIKEMIRHALEIGATEVCIFLSSSHDPIKNPLPCEEKKRMLINYIIPKIIQDFTDEDTPINIPISVECWKRYDEDKNLLHNRPKELGLKYPGKKLQLMVGSDRVDDMNGAFEKSPLIEVIPTKMPRGIGNPMSGSILRGFFIEDMNRVIELIETVTPDVKEIVFDNTTLTGISHFFNEIRKLTGQELFNIEPREEIIQTLVNGKFAEEIRKIGIPDYEIIYLVGLMLDDKELINNFLKYTTGPASLIIHTPTEEGKMGGAEEMGGGTTKRKTNKRKTNKRKTNKRKTNKKRNYFSKL